MSPVKKAVFYTTLVLLYTDVFSGLMRYAFNVVGVNFMSYLPMLSVIATVAVTLSVHGAKATFDKRILAFLGFYLAYALYALLIGRSPFAILFGLYSWSPVFLGILVIRMNLFPRLVPHIYALLIASLAGVFLSAAISVPWLSGSTYEVAGIEVSAARQWGAFGVERLPGFSRSSALAGFQIAAFLLWALCLSRSWLLRLGLWAASTYAIVLTTSKTPLMVVIVGPILLLAHIRLSRTKILRRGILVFYSYAVAIMLLVCVIIPPSFQNVQNLFDMDGASAEISQTLPFFRMDSFTDRAMNTWPQAFDLLGVGSEQVQSIFGRGIGGIGVGQQVAETSLINAGDNLHVYLYVTFGVFAYLFYAILIAGHGNALSGRRIDPSIYFATLLSVLGEGTLNSAVEAATSALCFGLLIAVCIAPRVKRQRSAQSIVSYAADAPLRRFVPRMEAPVSTGPVNDYA